MVESLPPIHWMVIMYNSGWINDSRSFGSSESSGLLAADVWNDRENYPLITIPFYPMLSHFLIWVCLK